ncbi:MAG: hypothetical protein ACRDPL_13005 [Propionibacteriaceae bacterium]
MPDARSPLPRHLAAPTATPCIPPSAIDEIKKQTEFTEQFITTAHTGRAKLAEGDERASGATPLDDWVGSRMVMTREGENRFLYGQLS